MKKMKKKGFTLVELLVVIAIIAILAVVSVVGYTAFIKKANLSNDQTAITQMNTGLQASAVPNGFENPGDAIDALYNIGWNLGKLEPYSNGYHYAYNYQNNKMYLLDDNDNVVYPEETDKSNLWGFYDNTNSGLLNGITKYIAMANITNVNSFASGTQYEIDLNRHYIDVDGTYNNITIFNGGVVDGTFTTEGDVVTYTKYVPGTEMNIVGTFENVVFDNYKFSDLSAQRFVDAKFVNCVFYDSAIRVMGNVEFTGCEFVGTADECSAIDIYDESNTASYVVKITDSTFTGGYRAINTSGQDVTTANVELIIDGCEFNAVGAEKGIIQIARIKQTVTIKNTEFTALGQSKGIISLYGSLPNKDGASADALINQFTFEGNTINDDIPVEQYVFWRSDVPSGYENVDETITNKMK